MYRIEKMRETWSAYWFLRDYNVCRQVHPSGRDHVVQLFEGVVFHSSKSTQRSLNALTE